MSRFLTTSGISHHLEEIIKGAKSTLVLISPYLQMTPTLFERLKDADAKNIRIIIVYGKKQLKDDQVESLAQLKNLSLHYFQNLHAKCYFNETHMLITSMNMYEFSEKNNREMGILLTKIDDADSFNEAVIEA
ncbi:MAG: hypothetical protein GY845_27250, partial [Planctomycetes bacterium]|nr:hypothetical protein [Planctomycetota bacterium]